MNPVFTNETIDIHALPKYETVVMEGLDPKYKKIMWLNFWISTVIFTIIVLVPALVLFGGQWQMALFFLPVLFIQGINLIILNKLFNSRKYAIREKDIIYKSGLINHNTTILSFNRIQHVSIHESWLARRLQLAKIEMYSTGDSLSIPGLPVEVAQKIKALILHKISKASEDANQPMELHSDEHVMNENLKQHNTSEPLPPHSFDDDHRD